MKKLLGILLFTISLYAHGQTTKTLYGPGITNIGTNFRVTMNGSDTVDRYRSSIGRKLFSRVFLNLDSVETITSIGSDWISVLDATTGKFKKITAANLGAGGGITSINSETGPAITIAGGTGITATTTTNTVTLSRDTGYFNSGNWTPTITAGTNVTTVGANQGQWLRVGNVITFSVVITATTTSGASSSDVRITLPRPSAFANTFECAGTNSGLRGGVAADVANDEATISWTSGAGGSETIIVHATYWVIPSGG